MANWTAQDTAALQGLNAAVSDMSNTISTAKSTAKDRAFMREMWDRQKTEWYYQQKYLEDYSSRLTSDARRYSEDLTRREWEEYNSPEAQIRAMRAAGINPNAMFGNGSSPMAPNSSEAVVPSDPSITSGMTPTSAGGYSPRYYQNPLVAAQVADLVASADLKKAQAGTEPFKQDNLMSQTELERLKSAGMPYANEMLAINAQISRMTMQDKIDLSSNEVRTAAEQLNLLGRQIQELDDKHDLHGFMKQQAINQCAIQVASFVAKVWEAKLTEANVHVSNATVQLLIEQAREVSIDVLTKQGRYVTELKPILDLLSKNDPRMSEQFAVSKGNVVLSTLFGLAPLASSIGGFVGQSASSFSSFIKDLPSDFWEFLHTPIAHF